MVQDKQTNDNLEAANDNAPPPPVANDNVPFNEKAWRKAYMKKYMRAYRRNNPAYRERERAASRERERAYRERQRANMERSMKKWLRTGK